MITIRSSEGLSEPSPVCVEATIETPTGVLSISSNGPILDHMPFGNGLFGAMSWPRSRFQIAPGSTLEQQMFLPHDGSGAALSWELRGHSPPARLIVRPFFASCSPRLYRDKGFVYETEEEGGRLVWLPTVRGPKIIADTNGIYFDEPTQTAQSADTAAAVTTSLIAPGRFEFELTNRPSVLILSPEGQAKNGLCLGNFLASLAGCEQTGPARGSRVAATERVDRVEARLLHAEHK